MAEAQLRIQQCKRLKKPHLDLSGMGLIIVPQEIFAIEGLTSLDLSGNKLSSLDSKIGKLTSLTDLSLEGNSLKSLPQELSKLKALETLNLKGNPLSAVFQPLLNAKGTALPSLLEDCLRKYKENKDSNDLFDDMNWEDEPVKKMTKVHHDDDDFDFGFDDHKQKEVKKPVKTTSTGQNSSAKPGLSVSSNNLDRRPIVQSKTPQNKPEYNKGGTHNKLAVHDDFGMDDLMNTIALSKSKSNYTLLDDDEIKLEEVTIYNKISQGGFSIVQRGMFRGTEIAIKKIFDPVITDKLREEMDNEVEMLNKIRHPNIVLMMGYSANAPNLFIIFEIMKKGALFDILHKQKDRPSDPVKYKICYQVASALNYIHQSKVVHRDIKSHNVLLDENMNAKLCDFGIARKFVSFAHPERTESWRYFSWHPTLSVPRAV
jgi:tRNA A-37 threonylcarbamoyl transferase component Bud32